jgi:hypothetical protein
MPYLDGITNDASTEAAAALLLMNASAVSASSKDSGPSPPAPVGSLGITPHANDILNGRGNGVNSHPGNVQFRALVSSFRKRYLAGGIPVKREVTKHVMSLLQNLDPPARFLKRNPLTEVWEELDYDASFKKTSQALREKAPIIRKLFNLDSKTEDVEPNIGSNTETSITSDQRTKDAQIIMRTNTDASVTSKEMVKDVVPLQRSNAEAPVTSHETIIDTVSSKRPKLESLVTTNGKIGTSHITIFGKKEVSPSQKQKRKTLQSAKLFLSPSLFDRKSPLKDLEFRINYRTFSIYQSPMRHSEPRASEQESHEKLMNLAIFASSSNLTNLFIMTKMCSDAFETLSGPTSIPVALNDVLIGAQFDRNNAHAGNVKLAAQFRAQHDSRTDGALTLNSKNTMNHKNTRFFELDHISGKWKILSMKEAKNVMDSLEEQSIHCCFEPSSVDVLIPPEKNLLGIPAANKGADKKNLYFDLMLKESNIFLNGSNEMKNQIAR